MINERLDEMPEGNQSGPTPEEIKELLQQSILRHFPNPERKECLGFPALREIAGLRLPFEDSRWNHVERCSPCYREFLDFRREFKHQQRKFKTLKAIGATAAIIVCVGASIWLARVGFVRTESRDTHGITATSAADGVGESVPILDASLDLQSQSLKRSATPEQIPVADLPHVPRGRIALTISLPVGAEAGEYTIRLLNSESDPGSLATFNGVAEIKQGTTTLRVTTDFSRLAPGSYVLAIRHAEFSWAYYRFVVT